MDAELFGEASTWGITRPDPYMEGVKHAIYEIMKEADVFGSQEIRDSGDTDDGMCARAAKKICEVLTAEPVNKPLTLEQLKSMHGKTMWVKDIGMNEIQCLQFDKFRPATYHKGDDARFIQFGTEIGIVWWCCKYGKTWLAYASDPEGSDTP